MPSSDHGPNREFRVKIDAFDSVRTRFEHHPFARTPNPNAAFRFNLLQNFTGDNENQTEELAAAGGRNDSATGQAPNENRREGGDLAASRSEVNRNGNRPSSGTSPRRIDDERLNATPDAARVPGGAVTSTGRHQLAKSLGNVNQKVFGKRSPGNFGFWVLSKSLGNVNQKVFGKRSPGNFGFWVLWNAETGQAESEKTTPPKNIQTLPERYARE
ncbi:hypothetical protein R3P38DRAFT_2792666 [Favolaschia claudopus]|uniref:Uncharacterized protein n=1 Tax=Favolaschia claudopus TaxID=2862362 RepID=A0AAW0AEX9_9AGAR